MKSKKLPLRQLIPVIVVILTVVFIWLCTSENDLKNELAESTGNTTESLLVKVTTEERTDAETTVHKSTLEETSSEMSASEETSEHKSETEGNVNLESTTIQNSQTKPPEIQTTEIVTSPNTEPPEPTTATETLQPPVLSDNGIFSGYYAAATARMQTMTTDEKIGQMLFARCPSGNAAEIARQYHIGGYVLFGRDFQGKTAEEVKNNISSYRTSQEIPMVIATDEEGGRVVRVSSNPLLSDEAFSSPRDIFNSGGMELIKSKEVKKAEMLSGLYIDTNFAPVCDISVNESDFMYPRSLGQNAGTTADFVRSVTQISQSKGVSAALKHFPGYGNNIDTHTGIAVDTRDYNTFVNNDFIPFQAGIQSGVHLVMVSHNIVNCMDSTKPASISKPVHNILRNELGFTGIIVTDDLSMDAIKLYSGEYPPTVTAVLAGNDMLIISDIDASFNEIKNAVNNGTIEQGVIDRAVVRILAWKYAKGLM
ncbi:MAG: beta-hexosaminidase [Lachnospiraceae bacterium]|nr:beta-hexosaminidase [Lachnospiraceae bacterium]